MTARGSRQLGQVRTQADELAARLARLVAASSALDRACLNTWPDLSASAIDVLVYLEAANGDTATSIAGTLGVTKGRGSQLLAGLVEAGYVAREADTDDGRVVWFRLGPRGRQFVDQVRAARTQVAARALAHLDAPQRQVLLAALDVLASEAAGLPAGSAGLFWAAGARHDANPGGIIL